MGTQPHFFYRKEETVMTFSFTPLQSWILIGSMMVCVFVGTILLEKYAHWMLNRDLKAKKERKWPAA